MEFIWPMPIWEDFHPDGRETFKKFRRPVGEKLILEGTFVEQALPAAGIT
jgi:haloalkane dehalogenase